MSIEDGKALRAAVAAYLGKAKPEGFPSSAAFRRLPVEVDRRGRIRIGSWVFDPAAGTLTEHAPPGQIAGRDLTVHVSGHGVDWKVDRVSWIEVFE